MQKQPIQVLNPAGKPGVASIRYVAAQGVLVGLLVDQSGQVQGLATIPLSVAQANPQSIGQQGVWQNHGKQTKRDIVSLGRPKASRDGTVKIIANLEGGYECVVTLQKQGRDFKVQWGQEQKTHRLAIGIVNGTEQVYASFEPQENGAEIYFETAQQAHPAAQQYLQQ